MSRGKDIDKKLAGHDTGWLPRDGKFAYDRNVEAKFLLDGTVDRLCRWLRLLGFDAELSRAADDVAFLVDACNKGRIALTRKQSRVKNAREAVFIESGNIRQQLKQVLDRFGKPDSPLSRCSLCNTALVKREKIEIEGLVPEYPYKKCNEFYSCPNCKKFYWRGTHPEKMKAFIEDALSASG
ncbi:MAG: Mut7-C RNAse domain-containing protein [Candidatus Eisenbacteria bacterium]|nr:Mut7-C RNAse domain-containing protein [Candidatus Eisenbacteria bacterium]